MQSALLPQKLFVNQAHNFIRIKAKITPQQRMDLGATRKILSNEPPVAFPLSRAPAKLFCGIIPQAVRAETTSPSLSADRSGRRCGGEHKERQISAHFSAQRYKPGAAGNEAKPAAI
jgi:hypothetical protein